MSERGFFSCAARWRLRGQCEHHSHSLLRAWPAEGRNVLHIERSWPAIQAAPTDRPMSSSTCCSQFLCGRLKSQFWYLLFYICDFVISACKLYVFTLITECWRTSHFNLRVTFGSFYVERIKRKISITQCISLAQHLSLADGVIPETWDEHIIFTTHSAIALARLHRFFQ